MSFPILLSVASAYLAATPDCKACRDETRLLVEEISDHLDWFSAEVEEIEEALEIEDILLPRFYHEKTRWTLRIFASLVPALGVKIFTLPPGASGRKLDWEIFLAWRVKV